LHIRSSFFALHYSAILPQPDRHFLDTPAATPATSSNLGHLGHLSIPCSDISTLNPSPAQAARIVQFCRISVAQSAKLDLHFLWAEGRAGSLL